MQNTARKHQEARLAKNTPKKVSHFKFGGKKTKKNIQTAKNQIFFFVVVEGLTNIINSIYTFGTSL